MMHGGYSGKWIIDALLVASFVLGGFHTGSSFYEVMPVSGNVFLDLVIWSLFGGVVSVFALLGLLLLAAVISEALYVGERVVKQ